MNIPYLIIRNNKKGYKEKTCFMNSSVYECVRRIKLSALSKTESIHIHEENGVLEEITLSCCTIYALLL